MKFIFTIIFAFIITSLINVNNVFAADMSNPDQVDTDTSEKVENTNDTKKNITKNNSEEDLFGDEQTFPFVAGLGKNAAH